MKIGKLTLDRKKRKAFVSKFSVTFCLLMIITSFLHVSCLAVEVDIYADSGAKELPQNEYITDEEANGDVQISFASKIVAILKNAFPDVLGGAVSALSLLLALTVISSVFKSFRHIADSPALGNLYDFISVLVISLASFNVVKAVFEFVSNSLNALNTYTTALLPVMTTLYALSGSVNAGCASGATAYLFLTASEMLSSQLLMKLLQIAFALSLVSSVPGGVNISSVSSLVKNGVSMTLAFLFTLFGFIMYFQTTIAVAADNMVYRSVKFASGVFIPIIGSIIGDSARMVFASASLLKSTVGAVGLTVLLSCLLPPILAAFVYKGVFIVCGIAAKALSLDSESKLFTEINGLINVLIALAIGVSVSFIIILAVFIKTGIDL